MIWPYTQYLSERKPPRKEAVPSIAVMDDSHDSVRNMSNPLSSKSKRMKGGRAGGYLESIRCFSGEQKTDR